MDITYFGHSCFKFKTKTASVVCDPFDPKMVGIKYPALEAEIVTVSHDHGDHNFVDKVSGVKKVITEPGEYEVKGVSILGFQSFHDKEKGGARGANIIFVYEAEELRICHLGDLGHELSEETLDRIGAIDILIVPVGGEYTIDSKLAASVAGAIDPYFIIPMHYKEEGKSEMFSKLESVESFVKESGINVERMQKLSIKKEDIVEGDSVKIVILERK